MADQTSVIHGIFNQYLGRNASDSELQGFQQAMNNGVIDPIGLGLFLQGSSEYAQKQGPGQATSLINNLQSLPGYDNSRLLKQQQDQAISRYASLGRGDTSALASDFAQIGANQAQTYRNMTYGAGADYLSGLYGSAAGRNGAGYGMYGQGRQSYQDYSQQSRLANQQYGYAQNFYNQAASQARQNQWFGLAGGLLQGAGSAIGGFARGGYF